MNRRLPVVAAVLALTLAACGDDGGEPTATSAPTTSAATSSESASGGGAPAGAGDQVAVHYVGTLDDGEVFDSSRERDQPLLFELGVGMVVPGFDAAVTGMAVGETKTVRLEPAEAYGERDEDLILEFPLSQAPEGVEAGDLVTMSTGAPATILEVTDEVVVVDANHPLAGQALTFEIELVSIG